MEVIEILRSLVLNSNMSVNEKEDNLTRLAKLDEKLAESESMFDFTSSDEKDEKEADAKEEVKS